MNKASPSTLELSGEQFAVVFMGDLDPDFRKSPKTNHFCCLCQRDIKTPIPETGYVHMIDGGNAFLTIADEARYNALSDLARSGDMYSFPVGPECAKKFPKGYVHKKR